MLSITAIRWHHPVLRQPPNRRGGVMARFRNDFTVTRSTPFAGLVRAASSSPPYLSGEVVAGLRNDFTVTRSTPLRGAREGGFGVGGLGEGEALPY
eukprot:6805566-Prymnesium_polylepis.1